MWNPRGRREASPGNRVAAIASYPVIVTGSVRLIPQGHRAGAVRSRQHARERRTPRGTPSVNWHFPKFLLASVTELVGYAESETDILPSSGGYEFGVPPLLNNKTSIHGAAY